MRSSWSSNKNQQVHIKGPDTRMGSCAHLFLRNLDSIQSIHLKKDKPTYILTKILGFQRYVELVLMGNKIYNDFVSF